MHRCRLAVAVSACLAAGLAQATEGDPLRAFVTETVTRDDNIFRVPEALAPVSDTITSTGARVSLDKQFSRQHLQASVSRSRNRYQSQSQLDNDSTNDSLNWGATFPERVTADAGVSRSQTLANYADMRYTMARDIVTGRSSFFRLGYAFHPDWLVTAQATDSKYRNSAAASAISDLDTRSREASLQYTTARGSVVSLLTRTTDGHYPNQQFFAGLPINNDYRQDDLEATLQWAPSVKSTLVARVGHTRRTPDAPPQRSFTGSTWNLAYNWTLTAATGVNAYVSRDLTPQSSNLVTYAVVRAYGLAANWTPTAKITASAHYDHLARNYGGDLGANGAGALYPTDTTRSASLDLQYAPTNFIQLSLQFKHESRASTNINLPYTDNAAILSATLSF